MKNIIKLAVYILIVICVYIFKDNISTFIVDDIIYKGNNTVLTYNEYYLDTNFNYVQNVVANSVNSKQEILNMFYSIINSGDDTYSFKCNYDKCVSDVKEMLKDEQTIAIINNFVHPYNSFYYIDIYVSEIGKITVTPKKVYTDEQIIALNNYINNFKLHNINDDMSDYDKIKVFHDYIVNNTIYDDSGSRDSSNAYTLITDGKSICGGYSDIISIYLNSLGIKNYKITSSNHVWNLVNIDDSWLHLDATWDDPIASDGNQYLLHNFFLINTEELLNLDIVEHSFDRNIYSEAN